MPTRPTSRGEWRPRHCLVDAAHRTDTSTHAPRRPRLTFTSPRSKPIIGPPAILQTREAERESRDEVLALETKVVAVEDDTAWSFARARAIRSYRSTAIRGWSS